MEVKNVGNKVSEGERHALGVNRATCQARRIVVHLGRKEDTRHAISGMPDLT